MLKLQRALPYFHNWKLNVIKSKEFLSDKTWFDLQSMILGFISLVKSKLTRFPGSCIKPAIVNQDVIENHFCQLKGELTDKTTTQPTKWSRGPKIP